MTRVYRAISGLTWALGLAGLVFSTVLRFSAGLAARFNLNPRGGLIFAGTLFLCALATSQMEHSDATSK